MGMQGIRLSDLYGSQDFNDWLRDSTNAKLVKTTIEQNRYSDPDAIKGHLYMNSKIKKDFGEDVFNSLPEIMGLDEKVDWYNSHLPEETKKDTTQVLPEEYFQDTVNKSGFYNSNPPEISDGDIVPKSDDGIAMWHWFQDRAEKPAEKQYQDFIEGYKNNIKSNELMKGQSTGSLDLTNPDKKSTQIFQQLDAMRREHPENTAGIKLLENKLKVALEEETSLEEEAVQQATRDINDVKFIFNNFQDSKYTPVSRELWNSAKTENTIQSMASEIRLKLDSDPQFAFEAFEQFDRLAYEMIPQYRNYHDTDAMPITPNEMKDIMAEYYANRTIKDINEANDITQRALQHALASHQSILQKSDVAINQAAQNFAGNTAATLGIVLNTPNAIRWAIENDTDIEDLSGFKEFLYYTTQNPITQWGNDLQTTGTWLPDAQKRFKEMEYNAHQLQREVGSETKFLDINTPFDLFAQGAYTVAGMFTGTTTAQLLNATIGRATAQTATKLLAREASGWGTRFAARAINTLGNLVAVGATAYLPAAAEASMDAMEKFNTVKESAENDILAGIDKELQQDLRDGTFEKWYAANTRLPDLESIKESLTPEELQKQAELRQLESGYLWEQYRNLKVQQILNNPEIQKAIQHEAFRTGAKTMFDEATWIAFGDSFFSNILGKSFKELKKGVVRGITGKPQTRYNWVPEGNYYKAVPKQVTGWQKVKAIGKGLGEAAEEGFEELFQTVDSQMREDLAHNYIEEYIANRYDPQATGRLSDSMFENWDVASKSIGGTALSSEALYSFLLGAVSAGLGSPTIARGVKSSIDKLRKGQSMSIRDFWRNPIAENLQELKIKNIQDADEAAAINRWLKQHPEVATYNDETAILKFLADKEEAVANNDEVAYRDALMGQKVATMLMMDRVKPNGVKQNFKARLKELSKLDESSPIARQVLDQVLGNDGTVTRTTEGPLNEEEVAAIKEVADRAKKDLETYQRVKAQLAVLDSQFGNSISSEAKEALAYGLIMRESWRGDIKDIVTKARESYNKANPDSPVVPISAEEIAVKNAIARYGNLKNAEEEHKRLLARRNQLRAAKKQMYKQEYKTELNKNSKQIRENIAARKLLSQEGLPVIKANEILSLSDRDRAYMLDAANKKNYSEAQQKEIDAFTSAEGVNGEILIDLKNAGRIQNKLDYFNDQYEDLVQNNGALVPLFDREVRAKASEKWSRAKLGEALEATTYEEFRDAVDRALATGEFTANDKAQFSKIFNSPENPNKDSAKFYEQYKKEELSRAQTRRIIENSPAYKKLSEAQKQVASEVISDQQLTKEPITAQNIIEKLRDPKFLEKLSKNELEELATAIQDIMKQKESYDKAVAAEVARQKKLAATKMAEDKERRTSGGNQEETIINNKKYKSNKDFFDTIFKKVASIFTKTNPQVLTKEDFINLISLYSEEDLSTDILGEDFDTTLTLSNLDRITKSLLATVENFAYTHQDASDDVKYQNTMQLIGTLKGIIQIVAGSEKTDNPVDLNSFIRNSIIQVNPTMVGDFKVRDVPKLQKRLGKFSSKSFAKLSTEAEKKWYNDNNIEKNLAKVAALRAHEQNYVFIKDQSLINDVRQELGIEEFDDDNLPIILAAVVDKTVEGAIKGEDGRYYLYVGLLQDSRVSAGLYDKNQLNSLRDLALKQEEAGPIKDNNKVYVSEGAVIKYTNKSQDTVAQTDSIRSWLLDKHKGNKEAAKQDFIEHFRRVRADIDPSTQTASISYEWKGKTIHRTFQTENPNKSWVYSIYLLEKPDGTVEPKILYVRELDEFIFDGEDGEANTFDILSGPLLTDKKYQKVKELDFLRRPISYIYTRGIAPNVSGLLSQRKSTRETALQTINKTVNNYLSKRFNFKKAAKGEPEFHFELAIKDGELQYTVYELTDAGKGQYRDVPRVLNSISLEKIKSEEEVLRFIQDSIKSLMFDEEGNLRRDDNQNPLVKLQVNYRENESSATKVFDEDKVEDLLLANAWKLIDVNMNPVPETIEVNATVQSSPTPIKRTGNKVQDAIDAITQEKFIDVHEGEHFEVGPNETEVTTFIHGVDEGTDFESLANKMATNLGTSVDKLYRVWRRAKTEESVIEYMKANNLGSWVGLSRTHIALMCKEFERVEEFFKSRNETPISADLIFKGNVYVNGKTHFFIGKPDIITVDADGKYHIYDMKSFRYTAGTSRAVGGFNNPTFLLNGLANFDTKYSYWQQQMSIYRVLIESQLGEGTVVPEFGVIPVRLGYNPTGSVGDYIKPGIGAHEVKDSSGKALHLSFERAPLEIKPNKQPETITRCYDDAIRIPAIMDITTINPTGWKQMSKADELKSTFGKVQEEKTDVSKEVKPTVEPARAPSSDKAAKDMTGDEIEQRLAGDTVEVSLEELITGACDGVEMEF